MGSSCDWRTGIPFRASIWSERRVAKIGWYGPPRCTYCRCYADWRVDVTYLLGVSYLLDPTDWIGAVVPPLGKQRIPLRIYMTMPVSQHSYLRRESMAATIEVFEKCCPCPIETDLLEPSVLSADRPRFSYFFRRREKTASLFQLWLFVFQFSSSIGPRSPSCQIYPAGVDIYLRNMSRYT